MLLRWVSLLLLVTTTTATISPSPSPDELRGVLRRLDSLEQQVTLQQDQLDRERSQWHSDNSALRDRLSVLETDVQDLKAENHELKKGAQDMQQHHGALVAENQGLKSLLEAVHDQLAALPHSQRSAEGLPNGFSGKTAGHSPDDETENLIGNPEKQWSRPSSDDENPGGHVFDKMRFRPSYVDENRDGHVFEKKQPSRPGSPSMAVESGRGWRGEREDSSVAVSGGEREDSSVDVSVRSDDQGPLEVVVSHLTQQLTEVTADVQTLKTVNTQQDQAIQQARGSSFVRWGHSSCPADTDLVYSGVVGGSYHGHTGAATNALCLSMSPVLQDPPAGAPLTQLYGGEYETHDSHYEEDTTCAVCRSLRSTTIMVPGTNVCSSGWTMEYSGFLMAGYYVHPAGTEFICVDSALEGRVGSENNDNGHLLYFTETVCGSLPCPPYHSHKIVTCAVCSK